MDGAALNGEHHEAWSLASGSDEEDNFLYDDYGYYDGHNKFVVRLKADIRAPDRSRSVPDAFNVYSPSTFTIWPRESVVVDLDFDLIVPGEHAAVFRSREKLARERGLICFETDFGDGEQRE